MMMPDPRKTIPEDVRQLLTCAKPEQIERLLADVLRASPAKEEVKYDA
jgi:hypothetical protein